MCSKLGKYSFGSLNSPTYLSLCYATVNFLESGRKERVVRSRQTRAAENFRPAPRDPECSDEGSECEAESECCTDLKCFDAGDSTNRCQQCIADGGDCSTENGVCCSSGFTCEVPQLTRGPFVCTNTATTTTTTTTPTTTTPTTTTLSTTQPTTTTTTAAPPPAAEPEPTVPEECQVRLLSDCGCSDPFCESLSTCPSIKNCQATTIKPPKTIKSPPLAFGNYLYILTAEEGEVVKLRNITLQIEDDTRSTDCERASLEIKDRDGTELLPKACGSQTSKTVTSNTNEVRIVFRNLGLNTKFRFNSNLTGSVSVRNVFLAEDACIEGNNACDQYQDLCCSGYSCTKRKNQDEFTCTADCLAIGARCNELNDNCCAGSSCKLGKIIKRLISI